MKSIKLFALLFISSLAFTSCSDDDKEDPGSINEEELITTLKLTLTGPGTATTATTIEYKDIDGDGSGQAVITPAAGLTLAKNTTYTAKILLLNETESPAENITTEVADEADEHQFFYTATSSLNADFAYAGTNDSNGNPVGIDFVITTGDASNGSITIVLKHEPNKTAQGVKEGNAANAGGETDIQVTFPIKIE